MSTSKTGQADRPTTLQELLAAAGRTASPRLMDFTQLATAVRRERRTDDPSGSDSISRATALWTLMELDPEIQAAMEDNGLGKTAFGEQLSLRATPAPADVDAARLHRYLAAALMTYLDDTRDDDGQIDLADLATAILRSVRADPRGRLPERLGQLDVDRALKAVQSLINPLGMTSRAVSDRPSLKDDLDVAPLVDGLYELLNNKDTSLPLAIGVNAPWGAGKSSVMKQLEARLGAVVVPGETRRKWYTVSFEAWKYEHSERLWAALALAMYDQPQHARQMSSPQRRAFRRHLDQARHSKDCEPVATRTRTALYHLRLFAPLLGAIAVLVVVAVLTGTHGLFAAERWDAVARGVTGVATVIALARTVWLLVRDPFRRALADYAKRPDYATQLGFTSAADHDIRCLTAALTADDGRRVAVFVDDLDRVTSTNVVEVVGAINQIFNSVDNRGCVFVLGMDREIVSAAIEVAFHDTLQRLRERGSPLAEDFGTQFLSKIVQLSVTIPRPTDDAMERLLAEVTHNPSPKQTPDVHPSDVRRFERQIEAQGAASPVDVDDAAARAIAPASARTPTERAALDEAIRSARARRFTADSPDVAAAEFHVLRYLPPNPREVKRFDNAFRLQLYVANNSNDGSLDFGRPQLVALGKWVVLRLRWPDLAEAFDADPSLLKDLERQANRTPVPDVRPDARLAPWLADEALRRVLEEEDDRRLISTLPLHAFLRVA
jgi:hypothetical protein